MACVGQAGADGLLCHTRLVTVVSMAQVNTVQVQVWVSSPASASAGQAAAGAVVHHDVGRVIHGGADKLDRLYSCFNLRTS